MTIETGRDLMNARRKLGLSLDEMGRWLRLRGSHSQVRKRVIDLETGKAILTGPVAVAVEAFLAGYRPTEGDL